jgi:predicted nucleic acid-binding protein
MSEDAPRVAFDANIFFYAVDHKDAEKHRRCSGILDAAMEAGIGCAPLQALGEFCYAAVRRKVLTRRQAAAAANDWACVFETLAASGSAFELALAWWGDERLSYWDSLLLSTAAQSGMTAIVSEDMSDGMVLGGVEIISPFTADLKKRLAVHSFSI